MKYSGIGVLIGAAVASSVGLADDLPLAEARKLESTLQAAIARAEPSVACLLVRRERERLVDPNRRPGDLDDRNTPPDYYGSGVVIDPNGLILTNYHVVRKAGRILVRLPPRGGDGRPIEANASIFAADARSDLAVLKIERVGPLPAIALGEGEKLKKGSMVIAIGHPHAIGFRDAAACANWGIVSNLRRRPPGAMNELERSRLLTNLGVLVQTDARLQLGSSGGALIDLDGKLVGLTTAHAAITGVDSPGGFAVPMDANYRRIIEIMARGEEVEYGFLGVTTSNNAPSLVDATFIENVTINSPAERAGLRRGDAILAVNGQRVREYDDLFLFLATAMAGRRCELQVQSFGERSPRTLVAELVKSPIETDKDASRATARPRYAYGLRVDYTSIVAKAGEPLPDGVIVREVLPSSPAKAANLTEFVDVIMEVNDRPVNNPAQFYREVDKAAKNGDKLKLTLMSPTRTVTLP